ncbi:carboxypeptidase-like regulatory domain-containing protein [uncultured Microbulbifer sp.]|uniref:carboxypeptidase-like regulatory domain-containing protein n=1 Tax=uncultured Microbulbifer sp. TaxID=348147 RepID=UPI0025FA9345|nr:carboxypeptidase-like regulatory domain-containing protein [uncultured Microbulbifer sp.]
MLRKFVLCAVLAIVSGSLFAMSIFDAGKVCTFSAISGVILHDGQPVSGARVIRVTDYQKKKQDETVTDSEGYFELPAVYERHVVNLLPQEFVVGQLINVSHNEEEFKIWSGVKRKREENAESRGKPLVVTCELTREDEIIKVDGQPFITKCKWDVDPDVKEDIF